MLNFIMIKNRSKLEWNGEYGYQVYIKIIQEENKMTVWEELKARGLIAQVTDEDEIKEMVNNGKATFYIGFDPTADSLHVGHFMALCLMKRLQMAGNRPIALLGGGTGMIGDPSGRTDMRQMLTKEKLIVYNWGEYIDPNVITLFEEETGIDVVYEEFETNEIMYPKISSGAIAYDLVCPSDYMIQRMRENDLLAEINFDNIPNIKNIGKDYLERSKEFDPENKYSVPYCWGTVGILYNKTMVDEPIDSWSVLWDEKYKDNILMQDSVRDAFGVALKYLGYSLNSTDLDELNEAKDLLTRQKPLVQAYVIDQVRDKMIGNEAAIGVIYSGEAIYTQKENPNLEYVIPKEGSNIWIDSWVIPKNAEHKENAEKFINFLCRPDIALKNFEYITYSTPNEAARELIEDESIRNSKIAFPDASELSGCETFKFLGDKNDAVYNELWREVKSK